MKITEAKIRSIIKEEIKNVLNEGSDREKASQLIAAMNQINTKYDSMSIGQKVPPYKQDGDLYMIKEFINEYVSGAVFEQYLEELKNILSQQGLQVKFERDYDDNISDITITSSTPTHSSNSTELEELKNKIAVQDEYYDYELEGMFVDNLVDELGASRDDIANALKSYTSESGKKYTVEGEGGDMKIIVNQLSESRKRNLFLKLK